MLSATSYSENPGGEVTAAVKSRAVNGWFNATLLRKNLSRFWPLWALYTVIWLIVWPLVQFVAVFGRNSWYSPPAELAGDVAQMTLHFGIVGGLVMGVIFGAFFAMALFSYLTSPRAVSMFHGFPIRREGLFLTNYLTGLLVAVTGPGVAALLMALVQAASGTFNGYAVGVGYLCAALPIVFYYSLAVFAAMFTGQILAMPVFYGIANFIVIGVYYVVQLFASVFYFGFAENVATWVQWLTPVYYMGSQVHPNRWYYEQGALPMRVEGLPVLAIYAAVGLVLAALALVVYCRRKSETAGDVVAIHWARPLFRYGVAVCAALSLGQGLYFLLWQAFSGSNRVNFPALLLCAVFAGWVGYYAAEMLLKKSFRVFRSGLRGAAGLTAGLVIFGLAVNFDLLGVENRVPAPDNVAYVNFYLGGQMSYGGTLEGEESIKMLTELHSAILAEKAYFENGDNTSNAVLSADEQRGYVSVRFSYTMKDGSPLNRRYGLDYNEADVTSNPALMLLAQAATTPAVQQAGNTLTDLERFIGGNLRLQSRYGEYTLDASITAQQAQTLYDALHRDIAAGHVGKNALSTSLWEKETYANELMLYYQTKTQVDSEKDDGSRSTVFYFSAHCTELLAALKEMGLVTAENPLLTRAEQNALDERQSLYEGAYEATYSESMVSDVAIGVAMVNEAGAAS